MNFVFPFCIFHLLFFLCVFCFGESFALLLLLFQKDAFYFSSLHVSVYLIRSYLPILYFTLAYAWVTHFWAAFSFLTKSNIATIICSVSWRHWFVFCLMALTMLTLLLSAENMGKKIPRKTWLMWFVSVELLNLALASLETTMTQQNSKQKTGHWTKTISIRKQRKIWRKMSRSFVFITTLLMHCLSFSLALVRFEKNWA